MTPFRIPCAAFLLLIGAELVAAADPPRPNVLFAIADDWGHGHAGIYGCKWVKTPAFDRVGREGVLFENCFTSNPKCSPCRASILTGRNSWQTEEACCHFGIFPNKWAVFPDLLEEEGYCIGLTGKGWGPGDYKAGGFARNPAGPSFDKRKVAAPQSGIGSNDYAGNFRDFLATRKNGQPFCFWYGASEPHRTYEVGSGVRAGKDPRLVDLPKFFPDSRAIRSDYLDYALEVEWFDSHLGRMLEILADTGELENTIVVVTSDHGEPFPRVKGQIYERGFHLPLAVRWGKRAKGGRTVSDFVNVRDFMPTFLEAAGAKVPESVTGRSFLPALASEKSGWIDPARNRMLVGKERHDLGRPDDLGYPVRALRTPEYLYVRNYEPDRWPAGNPETGYRNVDGGPTKEFLLERFDRFYKLGFGKRPAEELYRVDRDPDCVENLATVEGHAEVNAKLRTEMENLLKADADPRVMGRGAIFDTYKYVGDRKHAYDTWLQNR